MKNSIDFNLRIFEQAASSGGSFLFLLSLPLLVDSNTLPVFYIYFAFAQASHGLMANYIFLPILSGKKIGGPTLRKRTLGMTFLCAGLIWVFLGNNPTIDFSVFLFLSAVMFCPAMTLIDIYRLALVRSRSGLGLSLLMNIVRWVVPTVLIMNLQINPIVAIVCTLLPIAAVLLAYKPDLARGSVPKQQIRSEIFDFVFAFVMALWGYVTTWSISGGQLNLISQFYAARNTLNFINTIMQFVEVHILSTTKNGKRLISTFLGDLKYVALTFVLFMPVGLGAILAYFELVKLGSISIPLLLTVLTFVYLQALNRLLMVVLRSEQKFQSILLTTFLSASIGCFLLVVALNGSAMIFFYAPLIVSALISISLFRLNKQYQHA